MRLSNTVACSNKCVVWKVRAMPRRATLSGVRRVMSCPLNKIRPEVGRWVPATRLKKVVLPAPLGPMMALIWPSSKWALTLLTAVRPPNRLVRFSTLSIGFRLHLALARSAASLLGKACRPLHLLLLQIADDPAREEDHQHHQQRPEHDHAEVLQELQILTDPDHQQGADQRPEQRADAANQQVGNHVEGDGDAAEAGVQETHRAGVQAAR